jgi:hypothetical protein
MNEKTVDKLATILAVTAGFVVITAVSLWMMGIQRQIRFARMMREATDRADLKLWDDEYYED